MPINLAIPGFMHLPDLQALERLARLVPPGGTVLEIGALFGRSTWVWSKSVPPDATVIVVDHWQWMPRPKDLPGHALDRTRTPRDLFDHYTRDCTNLVVKQGVSWETDFPELTARPADLVFIDSGHNEMAMRREVLHVLRFTDAARTIFCGDDYWEGTPEKPPVWPGINGMVRWLAEVRLHRTVHRLGGKIWALLPPNIDAAAVLGGL